ncbi:hypothetical protein OSB04_030390 [Centaurea solstitialis]|uniref:Uncharacterized protein n=1 Tax=Centaurea solstitialis TaxID=347529 RepID=A0AA38SR04_9ASTR|nr:hypothetical protein OSB04_030390 [Centaurea solstitialis]
MARIPMRFKRITEAFDDDARAGCAKQRKRAFANSATDLSDLVDSFFFEDDGGGRDEGNADRSDRDDEDDRAKCEIRSEVEGCAGIWKILHPRGLRGLCKSRWEKTGRYPAGEYEYIDVMKLRQPLHLEVSFGGQFTIARPTKTYKSLLEIIPNIAVIKPKNLKQVVRLMCAAMRASLKTKDMMVSPWRKNGYMQTKWFGSYKRTTNASVEVNGGF